MSDREKYDRDFVNTGDDVAGNSYTGKSLIRQLLDRKLLDRRSATGKKSPRISLWLWNFRGNTYRDVRTENEKVD